MRVGIFIDAGNMFYAQRDNGWHIAFERVLQYFTEGKELGVAYYFTASPSDPKRLAGHKSFTAFLKRAGYTVITKPIKMIKTKEGLKPKADLDVEMTMGILNSTPFFDEAVLFTGDSDFAGLITSLRDQKKHITCVARGQSTAIEVVNAANKVIDLNTIRDDIERTDRNYKK